MQINYLYNTQSVIFDSIKYVTCNQDTISFSTLEYIISNIKLYSKGKVFLYKHSFYLNPKMKLNSFLIDSVLVMTYDSMSLSIGDNHPYNALDININNMIWPSMMGGGFHFLKLEGYYKKSCPITGYTMHSGGNPMLPIYYTSKLSMNIQNNNHVLTLNHSIDKWISGATCYKISNYNYSMGVDSLMHKININGSKVLSSVKFE